MHIQLLKAERKKRGYTQEYMAKQLGYKDKSSYCLIENGKVKASVEVAGKISDILKLSSETMRKIFFA